MLKAIETIYSGYKFRSRLEARWAVFFDMLSIQYEYEKEGYDLDGVKYLPDFWLPSWQSWIEIKPEYPSQEEKEKGLRLWQATQKRCLIIWGSPYAYIPYNQPLEADVSYRLKPADAHFLHKHVKQWEDRSDAVSIFTECSSCNAINYSHFLADGYCHGGIGLGCHCEPHCSYGMELTEAISDRLIAAYTAARQARFERGERGIR